MLRGALRLSVRDFAGIVGCGTATVVHLERGGKPHAATLKKIRAAFEPYVRFIDPVDGVSGPGLILKPGFETAVRGADQGDAASQDATGNPLNSAPWDWEGDEPAEVEVEVEDDDEPLPELDWDDAIRADQIEHWRSRPEAWARLHEVSRQCLLRAMGVSSLGAE